MFWRNIDNFIENILEFWTIEEDPNSYPKKICSNSSYDIYYNFSTGEYSYKKLGTNKPCYLSLYDELVEKYYDQIYPENW